MLDNIHKLVSTNISLAKSNHKYSLQDSPDINFSSVTGIVDAQFPIFDKEKIAKRLVKVSPKYEHLSWEELVQEWDDLRDLGTAVHEELEIYINHGTNPELLKARMGQIWFDREIKKYGDYVFSEVIVFSEELKVAGCVDLLVYNDAKNECTIFDWKTSKKIDMKSSKSAITAECYDLKDCRYDRYSLQLSMYSYFLEQYHDISVNKMYMVHLQEFKVDCIEAKNLKNYAEAIFL